MTVAIYCKFILELKLCFNKGKRRHYQNPRVIGSNPISICINIFHLLSLQIINIPLLAQLEYKDQLSDDDFHTDDDEDPMTSLTILSCSSTLIYAVCSKKGTCMIQHDSIPVGS